MRVLNEKSESVHVWEGSDQTLSTPACRGRVPIAGASAACGLVPLGLLIFAALQSNFVWPKQLFSVSNDEWRPIALADAPDHFNFEGLTNEEFIDRADAVYVDLRGDGHKELIINNGTGGSGGRGWTIYDKAGGKWSELGGGNGGITFCSRLNGYYQIEVWSGGGGGYFTRMLLSFQGGRYHLKRLEDWKMIDGHRRFVDVRDPEPYDH